MNELDIIEQLTIAAEQAGANLAPTYQEYMPLAFAIANSCGEAGRSFFHRLCSLSAKYRQADADKLYDHTLQNGRGGNSLGTVFHLAQLAGVRFDKKLANLQNLQAPLTPTHTYVRENEWKPLFRCPVSRNIGGRSSCNKWWTAANRPPKGTSCCWEH